MNRFVHLASLLSFCALGALASACSAAGDDGSQSGDEAITGTPGDRRAGGRPVDTNANRDWRKQQLAWIREAYPRAATTSFQRTLARVDQIGEHMFVRTQELADQYGWTELHLWRVANTNELLWVFTLKAERNAPDARVYFFYDRGKAVGHEGDEIAHCEVTAPDAGLETCTIELE